MSDIKVKRVFHLKKKTDGPVVTQDQAQKQVPTLQKSNVTGRRTLEPSEVYFDTVDNQQIKQMSYRPHVQGPQLFMDAFYIGFQKLVGRVDTKEVKVTNVGSAAIYYEWIRVNRNKINENSILDQNPKFWCHHQKNVIKPGQQITFVFSFMAKIPGIFIQQFEFKCQPTPLTQLPNLKLQGKAFIIDEFQEARNSFRQKLRKSYLQKSIRETISDVIDAVKSPQEPRPDTNIPEIAKKIFQKQNKKYGLYYNKTVFNWWKQLYELICQKNNIADRHWNTNVDSIKQLIQKLNEQQLKISYRQRWENYFHLSRKKDINRSAIYKQVKDMFGKLALSIAGQYNDTARKQLDMWQVVWKQQQQHDGEQQKKLRQQQISKIKAQWLKKAKKKKWTQQDEKALIAQYKNKIQTRSKQNIGNFLSNLQKNGPYIKTQQILQKDPVNNEYFDSLQRLKTLKQSEIQGKKVLLKVNLKLKQNIDHKFQQFQQFLIKKKQQQKRIQQQKKDIDKQKKKPKKNTKKKQQQQQKPLSFDLMQILDQVSYLEILQNIRFIQQKSPKFLIILCNYGPKSSTYNQKFSLKFLHTQLKKNDPSVEFLPHQSINQFKQKVQNDSIADGTIILLQNINFLPYQVMKIQQNNNSTKLLMEQIRFGLNNLQNICDLFVNENRQQNDSGIACYLRKQNVLGLSWWKYIGISLKAKNSDLIIGGKFSPQKIQLIQAARWYANRIFLTGQLGIKFSMYKNKISKIYDIHLSHSEEIVFNNLQVKLDMKWQDHIQKNKRSPQPRKANIVSPTDILIGKKDAEWNKTWEQRKSILIHNNNQSHPNQNDNIVIDLGNQTIKKLIQIINSSKKIFVIDQFQNDHRSNHSSQIIFKNFYEIRQKRNLRHQQQLSKGVNFGADSVIILAGDFQSKAQKVQLKQVAIKSEQQEQQQQQEQQLIKNIKLIQDFHLYDSKYVAKLLTGNFHAPLSNINKYGKSDHD